MSPRKSPAPDRAAGSRNRPRGAVLRVTQLEDRTVPSAALGYDLPPKFDLFSPTGYLTGPQAGAPETIALSALAAFGAEVGFLRGDLAGLTLTAGYSDGPGQMSHLYYRQSLNGLPVLNTSIGVHLGGSGQVISINGAAVRGLAETVTTSIPSLTAAAAVASAAAQLGYVGSAPLLVSQDLGPARNALVADAVVSQYPIPVRLTYAYTKAAGVRLGWELTTYERGGGHAYNAVVDAETGQLLIAADWVDNYAETFQSLPLPAENPTDGTRVVQVNPYDPGASPFGWLDVNGQTGADFPDTRGNNVFAQADPLGTDAGDARPASTPTNIFVHPFDPSASPDAAADAAVVQLFYTVNMLHDIHLKFGFTEAAGNFQQTNYSGQGLGGDPVRADAQDGAVPGQASFYSPPDGPTQAGWGAPRLQVGVWNLTYPGRDGAFDNGIVIHEFGHGVSNRLTGGPADASALEARQSSGMGEGWSDWWALMLLQRPTDAKAGAYSLGSYVGGQSSSSPGTRSYPYSFDMSINPLTFADYNFHPAGAPLGDHAIGEIWASALWDLNWLLIDKYGYDPDLTTGYAPGNGPGGAGNKLALQLVSDGLKLQPANPTFIEARDAILLADRNLTGGQNQQSIWAAFARRGLGYGASVPGNDPDAATVSASFAMPPAAASPTVVAQSPAGLPGSPSATPPDRITVTFSTPMNPASFDPTDDIVSFVGPGGTDLKPSAVARGFSWLNPHTLQINFTPPSGPAAQGRYTLVLAPTVLSTTGGSLDQNFNGAAGEAADRYAAYFQFDAVPLTISAAQPSGGSFLLVGADTLVVDYNEPLDPASVDAGNVQVSQGTVTGFTILSPTRVAYTLSGLEKGTLYLSIKYGAVSDPYGFPVRVFHQTLSVDVAPSPPVSPPLTPPTSPPVSPPSPPVTSPDDSTGDGMTPDDGSGALPDDGGAVFLPIDSGGGTSSGGTSGTGTTSPDFGTGTGAGDGGDEADPVEGGSEMDAGFGTVGDGAGDDTTDDAAGDDLLFAPPDDDEDDPEYADEEPSDSQDGMTEVMAVTVEPVAVAPAPQPLPPPPAYVPPTDPVPAYLLWPTVYTSGPALVAPTAYPTMTRLYRRRAGRRR